MFYAWPESSVKHIGDAARLEYEVYFPENFPFIKGGKLPGFLGGDSGCGGGVDAAAKGCWSGKYLSAAICYKVQTYLNTSNYLYIRIVIFLLQFV